MLTSLPQYSVRLTFLEAAIGKAYRETLVDPNLLNKATAYGRFCDVQQHNGLPFYLFVTRYVERKTAATPNSGCPIRFLVINPGRAQTLIIRDDSSPAST